MDRISCCHMHATEARMNSLGVEGCRRERAVLLAEMKEIYGEVKLTDAVRAALPGVTIDPADVLGAILDESVRREVARILEGLV